MPKQSQTAQAFARAEAKLREEVGQAEAALERAQANGAAAVARLEELHRVREMILGEQAPATPPPPKAKQAPKAIVERSAPRASRVAGRPPEAGTATRAVLDAVVRGARHYQEIREQTGFATNRIGGILPDLVKRGLVVRAGKDDYTPATR